VSVFRLIDRINVLLYVWCRFMKASLYAEGGGARFGCTHRIMLSLRFSVDLYRVVVPCVHPYAETICSAR
jgi:hypothetical protein